MMSEERVPEAPNPSGADRSIPYTGDPDAWMEVEGGRIAHFARDDSANLDAVTVASFGREWKKFNTFTEKAIAQIGDEYFDVVDEEYFSPETVALDLGCGSGRWSRYLAPRVGFIEAIDPSEAVVAAQALTSDLDNVRVTRAGVNSIPFADHSFDFIFSLGVLHHLPDTGAALSTATRKLKPGGLFLLYLYYALDNRGPGYKLAFHISNVVRRVVSRLPGKLKEWVCEAIALMVYFPLAGLARVVRTVFGERLFEKVPLHYYADKSGWVMRNDALDRFGTPVEHRFTREAISDMMKNAGLDDVKFSEAAPYWHAVGRKVDS